jgi:hypothetical protein
MHNLDSVWIKTFYDNKFHITGVEIILYFLNHCPVPPRDRHCYGCHEHISDTLHTCTSDIHIPYILATNLSDAGCTQQGLLHSVHNVIHHLLSNMNIIGK